MTIIKLRFSHQLDERCALKGFFRGTFFMVVWREFDRLKKRIGGKISITGKKTWKAGGKKRKVHGEKSIFRLKIYIFRLKIHIFRLAICIFRLKIENCPACDELFPMGFEFFCPLFLFSLLSNSRQYSVLGGENIQLICVQKERKVCRNERCTFFFRQLQKKSSSVVMSDAPSFFVNYKRKVRNLQAAIF